MCHGPQFIGKSQRTVDKLKSSTVPCRGTWKLIYNRTSTGRKAILFFIYLFIVFSASLATVDVNWYKIWRGYCCTVSRNRFQSFHTSSFDVSNLHWIPAIPAVQFPLLLYCIKTLYTDPFKLQIVCVLFDLCSHKTEFACANALVVQAIFSFYICVLGLLLLCWIIQGCRLSYCHPSCFLTMF